MGLNVGIGQMVYLLKHASERVDLLYEDLNKINIILTKNRLVKHNEPIQLPDIEYRGYVVEFPCSFLHYLRRFACYVWANPGQRLSSFHKNQDPLKDLLYLKMLDNSSNHLICHSDCTGYYVPIYFDKVIIGNEQEVPGCMLGSSIRLKRELLTLASSLDIPLIGEALSDETALTLSKEKESTPFYIERLVWFTLYENARLSIKYNSAIKFS